MASENLHQFTGMSEEQFTIEPEDYGRYADGWDEDKWQSQMEEHPLFMTRPVENGELPPLVEAIQQLKFDPELNSNNDLAEKYRDDGNQNFKCKKYKWAIDSYTEGIKLKSTDVKLNSILYGNRAASHLRIGNLRSALNDSLMSLQLDSSNMKSIKRVAECLYSLERYDKCIEFCRKHMLQNDCLEDYLIKSMKKQSEAQAKLQAQKEEKSRKEKIKSQMVQSIIERGIKLSDNEAPFRDLHPAQPLGVHMTTNGSLAWPVIFAYPEYGQTDFIQSFNEDDTFIDHLQAVFAEAPSWDTNGRYKWDTLRLGYMSDKGEICYFDPCLTLRQVMSQQHYTLTAGNPTFSVSPKV